MVTQQDQPNKNPEDENQGYHLHDHPQNASGKPGKELSSDQDEPEFDQSEENESLLNEAHAKQHQDPAENNRPQDQATQQNPGKTSNPANPANGGIQTDERQPVDRPIKNEDGELL